MSVEETGGEINKILSDPNLSPLERIQKMRKFLEKNESEEKDLSENRISQIERKPEIKIDRSKNKNSLLDRLNRRLDS